MVALFEILVACTIIIRRQLLPLGEIANMRVRVPTVPALVVCLQHC